MSCYVIYSDCQHNLNGYVIYIHYINILSSLKLRYAKDMLKLWSRYTRSKSDSTNTRHLKQTPTDP